MRPDLRADFDNAQCAVDEMTPAPTWQQRLGWLLCSLAAVAAVTGLLTVIVALPAVLLWELVGR